MSRVGRKPIPLPQGVKIDVRGNTVAVQGPKGKLEAFIPSGIKLETKDGHLNAVRENDSQAAIHGLVRALDLNTLTSLDLAHNHLGRRGIEKCRGTGLMIHEGSCASRIPVNCQRFSG